MYHLITNDQMYHLITNHQMYQPPPDEHQLLDPGHTKTVPAEPQAVANKMPPPAAVEI
jgi:hypothetical protein